MTDGPRTNQAVRIPGLAALALGVALMAPARARGQIVLSQQQCAYREGFLTACATLLSIDFTGSTLTLVISNTSVAADHPDSYLARLFL